MKLTRTMFLTALAVGGLLTCGPLRAQQTPDGPSTNAPARALPHGSGIDRLAQALNLTDDQKTQVQNLLNTQRQQMTTIRQDDTLTPDDKRAKMKALRDDMNTQMKSILTADQYQKWMNMQTRMRRMSPPPASSGTPAGTNAPPAAPNT